MRRCIPVIFCAFVVLASLSPAAFGQTANGVQVNGSVTINATGKDLTNTATDGSVADLGVGRVGAGSKVGGDVRINATGENITNRATSRSKACVEVGTVGRNACQ